MADTAEPLGGATELLLLDDCICLSNCLSESIGRSVCRSAGLSACRSAGLSAGRSLSLCLSGGRCGCVMVLGVAVCLWAEELEVLETE